MFSLAAARHAGARFATTRWSVVLAAGRNSSREAMATLCELYWYPVYAFVRRRERDPESAFDMTQGFFTRFIEKNDVAAADPSRGRFRSFLCASLVHYLANVRKHARAQKRGEGQPALSLDRRDAEDRYARELGHELTAEALYERRFALVILEQGLSALRAEYEESGRAHVFEALKGFLDGGESRPHVEIATALGSTPGAVKLAVHRLRKRYREAVLAVVAETVGDPAAAEDELLHLLSALRAPG
jgi:RNA polymerase sigma factor (sigma-70 family)